MISPSAEGAFIEAQPYFLSAGKRDSARSLADMFVEWSAGVAPGSFALHGVIPYETHPHCGTYD
jgi:hypothetical protein